MLGLIRSHLKWIWVASGKAFPRRTGSVVTMSYFCYLTWAGRRHFRHHATSNYISRPVLAYQGRFEEVCFHTVAASAPLREQISLASVWHLALDSLERYQISRYSRMLGFPIMAASAQPRESTFSPFDTRSLSFSSDISQSNPYTALEAAVYLATIHLLDWELEVYK